MHLGIISRAEAQKRNFVVARAADLLPRELHQGFALALANRAIDVPCLTEAAAARAAAHDFQRDAVVYDAEIRHDRLAGEFSRVKVFDDSAHNAGIVHLERRHVDPANIGKLAEQLRLALARALCVPHRERNLRRHVLAVSNEHRVHKRGNRRGIAGTRAAADDQRIALTAVFGQQRDAGKIQHLQDVGIAHLVEERKADDVELLQRTLGFE